MELSSKQRGNLTELECITAFIKKGYLVSIPYGEDTRYDFLADDGKQIIRIQVKSCKYHKNHTIVFRTISTRGTVNKKPWHKFYTKEEIDYIATFYDHKCYVVPVEECDNKSYVCLHTLDKTKSGQTKNIKFCKDYLLDNL